MADIQVSKGGQTFTIDSSPESLQAAIAKGYTVQEQPAAAPVDQPEFTPNAALKGTIQSNPPPEVPLNTDPYMDITKDGLARVFKDGQEYHIEGSPESLSAAAAKGYKLPSEIKADEANQQKIQNYYNDFSKEYGAGATFQSGVLSQITPQIPAAGQIGGGNPAINPEIDQKYASAPSEYRAYLAAKNVPVEDIPEALNAIQAIESGHPVAKIAGSITGGLGAFNPAMMGGLGAAEETAINATGLAGKTALDWFGRVGVRAAVQDAVFNGPEALKNVIVDKDPSLAAENLAWGLMTGFGINAVAPPILGGLGKLGKGVLNVAKATVSESPISELWAAGRGAIQPATMDADRVLAENLSHWDMNDSDIANMRTAEKQKLVNTIEREIPNNEKMNSAQRGRAISDMGEVAGKDIGRINETLDEISKPNSDVLFPEAHKITNEADLKENFISQQVAQEFWKNPLSENMNIEDFHGSPEGMKIRSDAANDFENIKAGTLSQDAFVKQELDKNATAISASAEQEAGSKSFANEVFKREAIQQDAIDDYKQIRQFDPTKTIEEPGVDNYHARVNAHRLVASLDARASTAVGEDQKNFIDGVSKLISGSADLDGRISPSNMRKVITAVSDKINFNDSNTLAGLKKQVIGELKSAKAVSDVKIGAGAGKDGLLQELKNANERYRVYKLANEGKGLINFAPNKGGAAVGGRVIGGVRISPAMAAAQGARAVAKPYFNEYGAFRASKARLRAINAFGGDPVTHSVVEGAVKQRELIKRIPAALALATDKAVSQQLREEHQKYDGMKELLGDEANGLSKAQQYERIYDKLNDPNVEQTQLAMASEAGTTLAGPLLQKIQAMHSVLQAAVKPLTVEAPFQKTTKLSPTEKNIADLNTAIRLCSNPEELLKSFQAGTITDAQTAIVKAVFPSNYAEMIQTSNLEHKNIHFDLQQRLLYSILVGGSIDPSQSIVPQLQSVGIQPPAGSAMPAGPISGKGNRKPKSGGFESDSFNPEGRRRQPK